MTVALTRVRIKLVSVPYWSRVGVMPMAVALAVGWIFVFLWLAVAFWVFRYNPIWAVILSASTLAFAAYLGLVTRNIVLDSFRDYVFELNDTEAVLSVFDRLHHTRSTQMVLLDDIKFAEYYPWQDSSSIIFHAPYIDMEVPLSPMGSRGRDVVDFLDGRGVAIVNVQSDDKLPD